MTTKARPKDTTTTAPAPSKNNEADNLAAAVMDLTAAVRSLTEAIETQPRTLATPGDY